jgi:hypothetical protein
MKEAIFDPVGDARRQSELLELIPEPDEAFHRAAREAAVHAGLGEEMADELDQIARAPGRRG